MPRKFGEIAFTPEVEAAQSQRGSRQTYERYIANGPAISKLRFSRKPS
ncbi:hypothetical protein [Nostoc sp.]